MKMFLILILFGLVCQQANGGGSSGSSNTATSNSNNDTITGCYSSVSGKCIDATCSMKGGFN